MGGDYAPDEDGAGAVQAATEYDLEIVLVGDEKMRLNLLLSKYGSHNRLSVVHASQVIEMCEQPSTSIRKKKDASIVVATQACKRRTL